MRRLRVGVQEHDVDLVRGDARSLATRLEMNPARVGPDLASRLEAPATFGGRFRDPGEPLARATRGRPRKAYREHKLPGRTVCQAPPIQDLLLPMLMPPVALDFDGPAELPHRLYHYQRDGIEFLRSHESALLADEMGTGKTVQSTVAMRLLFRTQRIRAALVLCPLSLLGVWDRHLAEWAPELSVTVVHGNAKVRWRDWRCPAHVFVTTYDTLRGDLADGGVLGRDRAAEFDLLLLDEAQTIKNSGSGRTAAVRAVPARYRWALSGTPVENRLGDLVSLFGVLRPGLLRADDLTAAEASNLIGPFVKRRTKAEVMTELPPKIRQDQWLELDAQQRVAYERAEKQGRDDIERLGDDCSRVHIFSVITKLKMICNFAPNADTSPKLRAVEAQLEQIRASGKKALVFTQWLDAGVDRIAKALARFGVVKFDARLDSAAREAAIARFREDPEISVFVATVKSAGVGLTLTEASYVIHFD
ncbi:MAG: DEAD/DEAH box helicase, partial [Planctomycetes bacterium]|nr:DEAD/DEAH box helicase [Planctomycetota bacterium]